MMTRRVFLGMFPGACLARYVQTRDASTRYGALTVARHRRWLCQQGVALHVYHRGIDVTARCIFADDTNKGMAELLLHAADGRPYCLADKLATEIVHGVRFEKGAPFV